MTTDKDKIIINRWYQITCMCLFISCELKEHFSDATWTQSEDPTTTWKILCKVGLYMLNMNKLDSRTLRPLLSRREGEEGDGHDNDFNLNHVTFFSYGRTNVSSMRAAHNKAMPVTASRGGNWCICLQQSNRLHWCRMKTHRYSGQHILN